MEIFITLTTIIHGSLLLYDEYVIHKERGLTKREITGGIIDGFLYIATIAVTIFTSYSEQLAFLYISLATLSCLSIVFHELYYPDKIRKTERIIHALLYIIHPLILFAFYESWKSDMFQNNYTYWMLQLGYFFLAFKTKTYFIIYWNYIDERTSI